MISLYGETDLEEILRVADALSAQEIPVELSREHPSRTVNDSQIRRLPAKNIYAKPAVGFTPSARFLESMDDGEVLSSLPSRNLADEIIVLYFRNLHPFCPVINESLFCEEYFHLSWENFLERFPLVLFYAMVSVALAHINASQLRRMGYQSVQQAQSTAINFVKRLYRVSRYATSHQADEITLAKTCLLMSYWHRHTEIESNSSWAGRALYHTKLGLEGFMASQDDDPYRRKTLYWCCIIRNTLVNFAMRRPYRIKGEEEYLFNVDEIRAELEPEVRSPMFSTSEAKRLHFETLVDTCHLSQILSSLMVSRSQDLFREQWKSIDAPCGTIGTSAQSNHYVQGFVEAGKFNNQIVTLIRSYEKRIKEMLAEFGMRGFDLQKVMLNTVPLQYFRAMCYSSITVLYQPYLSGRREVFVEAWQRIALVKVKEASQRVAATVQMLLEQENVEAIPAGILGWTALPMATFMIGGQQQNPQELEQIMKLTKLMAARHHSAESVLALLEEISCLAPRKNGKPMMICSNESGSSSSSGGNSSNGSSPSSTMGLETVPEPRNANKAPIQSDLDLLVQATKMLDIRFSYEGPRSPGESAKPGLFHELRSY